MLETKFVNQNKEKWEALEDSLKQKKQEPSKMADFFTQVTEDLSYARTYYTHRSIRIYLNLLSQQLFSKLYSSKKIKKAHFIDFWKFELPATMYKSRKALLLAFCVFAVAIAIGVLSSMGDPKFVYSILGQEYVEETLSNIENGDPMAIYKQSKKADMFFGITINNLKVAFFTFVLGLILGIGTAGFLIYNGIMIGCFQYFFISKGLFTVSFFTIWLHGTLEISAILLAAAAGFELGKGIVFPGTFSRFQSFQMGAKQGISIMMGIIPLFVVAAFIEGFLTRYTEMPNLIRGVVILVSFGFVVYYFVVYQFLIKNHPEFQKHLLPEKPEALTITTDSISGIKSYGDIISTGLSVFSKHINKTIVVLSVVSLLLSFLWAWKVPTIATPSLESFFEVIPFLFDFVDFSRSGWLSYVLSTCVLAGLQLLLLYWTNPSIISIDNKRKEWFLLLINGLFIMGLPLALLFISGILSFLLFVFFAPLTLLWNTTSIKEKKNIFSSLRQSFALSSQSILMVIVQSGITIFMMGILNVFCFTPVILLYLEFLTWNLSNDGEWSQSIIHFFLIYFALFSLLISWSFGIILNQLLYENLYELQQGEKLKAELNRLFIKKATV